MAVTPSTSALPSTAQAASNARPVVVGMVTVALLVLCIQPFSATPLGGWSSFVPAMLALVGVLDVISAVLLVRQYRDVGDRRALVLAFSYVFSLTVLSGYGAAFPHVLGDVGPLGGWPSTAPWLWVIWHTGFPVLLAAAVVPWPRGWDTVDPPRRRRLTAWSAMAAAIVAGALLVVAATFGRGWLPVLIQGLDLSAMTRVTGPIALPLAALATAATVIGSLRLAGPMRWASLAAVAALADMALTMFSFQRFSLGWYSGRVMTIVASGVVLIAMLGEFNRMRRKLAEEAHLLRITLDRTAELESLHATLLDHMPDGVVLHDEQGRLVAGNRAALSLLGMPADAADRHPDSSDLNLLNPDGTSRPPSQAPHALALATREPQRDQMVGLVRPDGTRAWLRVNSTYSRQPGEPGGHVVSSLTDETERYEARLLGREHREGIRQRVREVIADPHRLSVVLQPIVDLRTGAVVGGEALSRFRGPPEQGPDVWFAEAEDVAMGLDLELVAVRRAIGQLDGVPGAGYLSVNVSPATILSDGLYEVLAGAHDRTGRIVLELTEHTSVADYAALQTALRRLRLLGARVAVDDAGSGFASLRHILQIEPDFVKLDLDLVRNIDQDPARRALAAGLLTFADQIGARLIGEGIENERELAALVEVGVVFGQGYHLGQPAPDPMPSHVAVPQGLVGDGVAPRTTSGA